MSYDDEIEDLVDWLLQYASQHKITVHVESSWPSSWVPQSQAELRLIWHNPNWLPKYEQPLSLAHEIGHILSIDGAKSSVNANTVNEKAEADGDLIAVGLILEYCQTHEITFKTKQQLIESFKLPERMQNSLDRIMDKRLFGMRSKYQMIANSSTGVFI